MYHFTILKFSSRAPEFKVREYQSKCPDVDIQYKPLMGANFWEIYIEFEDVNEALLFKIKYSL